jgi:hypothetical protein
MLSLICLLCFSLQHTLVFCLHPLPGNNPNNVLYLHPYHCLASNSFNCSLSTGDCFWGYPSQQFLLIWLISPHCQQTGDFILLYSVLGKCSPMGSLTLYTPSVAALQPCPSSGLHHWSPSSLSDLWGKSLWGWQFLPQCQHVSCLSSRSIGLLLNVLVVNCQAPCSKPAEVSATSSYSASLSVFLHTKSSWHHISHSITLSTNEWMISLLILCLNKPMWTQWAMWAMMAANSCRDFLVC